jgi:hypothetical protein
VVTADLAGEGAQTRVRVGTDLTISGALAQFGRGAITEISERLFAQFIERLKESLDAEAPPAVQPSPDPASPDPDPAAQAPAGTAPAEPADLLRVAGLPILKRVVPVLVVIVIVIVVLAVWLG